MGIVARNPGIVNRRSVLVIPRSPTGKQTESVRQAEAEQYQKQAEAVESHQGGYQVNERRKTRLDRRPHKEINKQGIDALYDELQYQWNAPANL